MQSKKVKLFIITLVFMVPAIFVFGQFESKSTTFPRIDVQSYLGKVLVHRESMDSFNKNPFLGNEIRIGLQTSGEKYWHSIFNYPTFGLGFYSSNFFNNIIGKPKALFLFMETPFVRTEKYYLSTSWGVGTTFNINEYDSIINPENIAIGSDMNVYIDFSLMYKYKFAHRWEFGTGIKLQHFSNGAYAYPNLGLNMASALVSIAYSPAGNIPEYKTNASIEPYEDIEIIPVVSCSWRSKGKDENNIRYFNTTTSLSVNKRVSLKRTVGVGFDCFYQGYLIDYYEDKQQVSNIDLMSYATFLSSDIIANRFRMAVQLGFYLHRPVDFGLFFYERVALRFYPTKHFFISAAIKAHAAKAEFIEWGFGYNF